MPLPLIRVGRVEEWEKLDETIASNCFCSFFLPVLGEIEERREGCFSTQGWGQPLDTILRPPKGALFDYLHYVGPVLIIVYA